MVSSVSKSGGRPPLIPLVGVAGAGDLLSERQFVNFDFWAKFLRAWAISRTRSKSPGNSKGVPKRFSISSKVGGLWIISRAGLRARWRGKMELLGVIDFCLEGYSSRQAGFGGIQEIYKWQWVPQAILPHGWVARSCISGVHSDRKTLQAL
jgi:hypothetical protein